MKLALHVREAATARQLAQLHAMLGEAKRLIGTAAALHEHSINPLRSTSQDHLIYLARAIGGAVTSLEQPFLARVGSDAPLAAPADPGLWLRWLDEHSTQVEP